jgi:hypothetical protein
MKKQLALLLVGLTCSAALVFSQPGEEKPVWHSDWPTAQRIAHQENKPIFAVLVCKH